MGAPEVIIDRLELVRQRVDARDREREVGIVLVSQAQAQRLDADPEVASVAVKWREIWRGLKHGDLVGGQDIIIELPGLQSLAKQLDDISHGDDCRNLNRF